MHLKNPDYLRALVGQGPGRIMTATALARAVECHPSTIDHLKNGRMASCRDDVALRIEQTLGLQQGVLFERAGAAV